VPEAADQWSASQYTASQYSTLQSLQPVAAPVVLPVVAAGAGLDVKTLFASLFQSSGPLAVAPVASGTGTVAVPATVDSSGVDSSGVVSAGVGILPTTSGLGAGGFGSSKAAVIYFAMGSSTLSKMDSAALHKVVDLHKRRGGIIRVVGHASNRTGEVSAAQHELINFDVSFRRARAVADNLIRHGIAPDKVIVIARSDSEPAYYESMPSGEACNRRVEVFIEF
jgi:outer membrane protein OmpA-like peptidoglycan-associated protein